MDSPLPQSAGPGWDDLGITCPHCHSGSTFQYADAVTAGPRGNLECPSCKQVYMVAEAIDEAVVRGDDWGFALFAGARSTSWDVYCKPGEAITVWVRGRFTRVFRTTAASYGGGNYLSGGLMTAHIPQGAIMLALAPGDPPCDERYEFALTATGLPAGAQPLPNWKELIVEARLQAATSPAVVPVFSVAAVDFFLTVLSGRVVTGFAEWNRAVGRLYGKSLGKVLGTLHEDTKILTSLRNNMGHGREYVKALPANLRKAETEWLEREHLFEAKDRFRPTARFSIRTALSIIRRLRTAQIETGGKGATRRK